MATSPLAACLRPDGVIAIMLYARYWRIGVEVLQGVCRDVSDGSRSRPPRAGRR
jgi:hypothetical protein